MPRIGWTTIASHEVPLGEVFYFDRFGVDVSSGTDGLVDFGVLVNSKPVGLGFGDFQHNLGSLNFLDMIYVNQRIEGKALIEIVARNRDTADRIAYGRIYGWQGDNA